MNAMFRVARAEPPKLTRSQRQALGHIVRGDTIDQAAAALQISPWSLGDVLKRARLRLGARTNTHAAALAVAWGIVDGEDVIRIATAAVSLGLVHRRPQ